MKIGFLSHTAMGGNFVVGSHHLAKSFASRGHEVLHVSAPVTPAHLLRLRDAFVRRRFARFARGGSEVAGVRDIVPFSLLPWALARRGPSMMAMHFATLLASPTAMIGALRLHDADCLIVDEPRLSGLIGPAPKILVYRATDLYAVMRDDQRILEVEREICRRADVLVGTSEGVAAHLRALSGRPVHVIGNGVDYEHFARARAAGSAPAMPGDRATRAIYVGAFDGRFSIDALRAAALALPGIHFMLAGPGGERVAGELGLPNIQALGAVDYQHLPDLLGACAVGLLPFSQNAANAGRSPMKLFEYAAAGLSIAATSTLRPGASSLPTLSVAASDDSFPAAVARAFELATDASSIQRARDLAHAEDWNAKAGELFRLLQPGTARGNEPAAVGLAPPLAAGSPWS
jgi:teichuronic acid biosynthesis glycosyltransferase TuaH